MEFRKTDVLVISINESQAHNLSTKSKIEKMLKQDDVIGFDIYDNDILIGFAMLKEWEKGKYFLWDYVIEYSLQNRGYGTKALKELIKFLQINYNCNLMTTTYKRGNLPAKHLYEKLGFVETDVVDDGDIHEVNMVLQL